MRPALTAILFATTLLSFGCGGDEGPDMRPGEDCLGCHRAGGSGPAFSAAGTIFDGTGAGVSGVTVSITDSAAATRTATTSGSGNFHMTESLAPPLSPSLAKAASTASMPGTAASGACNSCHHSGGSASAIHLP